MVVVGAGFAGAATAAYLVRSGVRRIAIVEAESTPGQHGSGRNAAMARRLIADPVLAALATESVASMAALEEAHGVALVRRVGGLLLGNRSDVDGLERAAAAVPGLADELERMSTGEAARMVPGVEGASATDAVYTSGCGVVDIHQLLSVLLDEARQGGAELWFDCAVRNVDTSGGRVRGVHTQRGHIACDVVVNAAGFAVNGLASSAGSRSLAALPYRRHLFVTAPWAAVDRAWPFVWDVTNGLYYRPEGEGLLMCACDGDPWPPEDPVVDPDQRERLAAKYSEHMPALRLARPARAWAGLRVLTPDDRFLVGFDDRIEGLFWAAGLGGHGMTTSCGVGRIAAEGITSGKVPEPYGSAFAPGRREVAA